LESDSRASRKHPRARNKPIPANIPDLPATAFPLEWANAENHNGALFAVQI
jgi:hypothetical protein